MDVCITYELGAMSDRRLGSAEDLVRRVLNRDFAVYSGGYEGYQPRLARSTSKPPKHHLTGTTTLEVHFGAGFAICTAAIATLAPSVSAKGSSTSIRV